MFWDGKTTMPDTPWLVKRLLPEVGTALLSGQWGMLKTFTLLDLAASLITGNPFAGYRVVRKGGVLVFAAEGAYELPKRIKGLKSCGKLPDEPQPICWQDSCPPLLSKGAIDELMHVAMQVQQQMQKDYGVQLALIAIDTVASAANFKDENSSAEGQAMMNVLAELARRMKCCVIGVDHFGKAVETGTRGASSKEAAADAVLALIGDRVVTGKVSNCRMAVRKLRGGPTGAEIRYTARELDLGTDRDGDPVTTMTIEWQTDATPKADESKFKRWSKALQPLRKALLAVLPEHGSVVRPYGAEGPEVRAVDKEVLRREFYSIAIVDSDTKEQEAEAKKKALNRALSGASSGELVGIREVNGLTLVWLTAPEDGASTTGEN
ncbi:hypothetical protein AC629_34970 [Bradyrhizobium sp. NAS80.1]|nr:hypothetical protein AC629_34970 [Bradyrhizobium sp. NAS80.1]